MTAIRLVIAFAVVAVLAGDAVAARPTGPIPLPRPRPALKIDKLASTSGHASVGKNSAAPLPPPNLRGGITATIPHTGSFRQATFESNSNSAALRPSGTSRPSARSSHASVPLAMATSANTSPLDLAAVKQAIDLVRKSRLDEATSAAGNVSDPLARKLIEWVILRSDADADFSRYGAFLAANPSWPGLIALRRRAEAALWQQRPDPSAVVGFFVGERPHSAKGRFALARALLAQGDQAGAQAAVREAWRFDSFSADLEGQARTAFSGLITTADDKARMDARFYADDDEAGMRAARHLEAPELAIAKARAAVVNKSSNAKALLDAVPAAARNDPGYMFSRIQWLRRSDKIAEAGHALLSAPHEPERLVDPDQWWVERRVVARKLLDLNDFKLAYEVANNAATPANENYRGEQHFTAGWIALRFLHDPGTAVAQFTRIAEGVSNPITLARAFYWQGRAAEALGRQQEARSHYETAARYPTAYYGQLARARLGIDEIALRALPEPPAEQRRLEVARAFEILYAVDERDLVATMAADLADKTTDPGPLTTLAEIATRHHDARSTLLIGKTALGHGLPFEHYAFPAFGMPNYQQIGPEVEAPVVYSIARQESAFNPRVVSSANALGLMQVTPEAGRFIAKKFNVAFDQRRLLDDPAYNAEIGTAELGEAINEFRGSYILAFAAYNAGQHRVKEWIEQYGDPRNPKIDPVDWIERIPFSETRNYVQRVIENMQVYRARMSNNSRLLIEADLRRGG